MKKAWRLARPGNSPPCTKIDEREELRRDNANKKEREKKKGVGKVPESMGMFEKRGRCGERERGGRRFRKLFSPLFSPVRINFGGASFSRAERERRRRCPLYEGRLGMQWPQFLSDPPLLPPPTVFLLALNRRLISRIWATHRT